MISMENSVLGASVTSELSMTNARVPDSARLLNIEGLKGH